MKTNLKKGLFMKYKETESSTCEFKRELPKNEQIIKTIIAFCNHYGGKLIIGIANDGTIVGVDDAKVQQTMEYLDKSIYQATTPPIIPGIYAQRIGGKTILIIEVSSGMNKPYYYTSQGIEKGTYIRLGRSTMLATPDMIEELKWQSRGRNFDTLPVYQATSNDLNLALLKQFFALKKDISVSSISQSLLKSYNILTQEHVHEYPTVAGLLLFGTQPQKFFPEIFIVCSHFSGIKGREPLSTIDCTGTLTEQFEHAHAFILSRITKSFRIRKAKREEQYEIPEMALREILMNAIAHRNYNIKAPTKIAIFDNRIEIFSPGCFPGPLNTENLTQGITYIRNIAICKILRKMGYIEKLGTGFLTLFSDYEERGLPKPQVIEGENYVKCILPRPSQTGIIKAVTLPLEEDLEKILKLFATATEITVSDVIGNLKLARATAVRRLATLVKQGTLKKTGRGKGTRYLLAQ
jgi:ATP-dependent DNA helicase RecG